MIGIIAAEEKEIKEVFSIMNNIKKIVFYEKEFYLGNIAKKSVIVVKCNVGKVNAARICQMLIDKFNVELVINIGTAGSVNNNLNIGDVILADKLVQYDFDVTPFKRQLGEIENIGRYIPIDDKLLKKLEGIELTIGTIATGDKFIVDKEYKEYIKNEFGALCVEMEGASIAQVCYLDKIPFLIIRSITDKLDGNCKVEFEKFLEYSSKKAVIILKKIIDKLN